GCSTAMLDSDSDPDFDKRTIRETERISDNHYRSHLKIVFSPNPPEAGKSRRRVLVFLERKS
ncbi:MAG: hypothetical protein LJE65_16630, partial [Desulfobacteraceae bacterium]|nr:hypothetical protein [Desulfobacteraceae bacterium]